MEEELESQIKIKPELSSLEERMLILKTYMKRKKPRFMRMDEWRFKRIGGSWRRPKGLDNKIRLERKGYPARVKIGYRTPKVVRRYHPSGFREVLVYNVKDLEKIDSRKEAIRIASTVGKKKRKEIIEEALKRNIKILNPQL
ncbi:MAG: 50S ribosomal protein L32e [Thermoprotei archaeon]|nr:MAG: 50S ribosomal protein L32e [Thermoprotei archaeon]RLF01100.1 MAG: 50S ribosomal protein L32e [Thermoprotei archaeon]HDH07376.1 50S ribosomal protein L32e [Thermoproteales archaeon]